MLKRNSHEQRDVYVEEQAWSKAFEHLAVSVAQLTLDGRLLSANKQMCEAIGHQRVFHARGIMASVPARPGPACCR